MRRGDIHGLNKASRGKWIRQAADENQKEGARVPNGVREHGGRKRPDIELHRGCLSMMETSLVPWLSDTGRLR